MKILIFFAPFGGGHQSAANSIKADIDSLNDISVEVKLIDITQSSSKLGSLFTGFYKSVASKYNRVWAVFYFVSSIPFILWLIFEFFNFILLDWLVEKIKQEKPDKIVTTYFIGSIISKACKVLALNIEVITFVSDPYTYHPAWLFAKDQPLVLMSKEAQKFAIKLGFPDSKTHVVGPIVKSIFFEKMENNSIVELKTELGLSYDKTVLIIGGGEGLKAGDQILKSLLENNLDLNVIVVCGRDENYLKSCHKIKDQYSHLGLLVTGFSDKVYEFMNISDAIITKAGSGILFEAMALEKPIFMNSYLWRQEEGNKDFIIEKGLGFYEEDPNKLAYLVKKLFQSKALIKEIEYNYNVLEFANGNTELVKLILNDSKLAI